MFFFFFECMHAKVSPLVLSVLSCYVFDINHSKLLSFSTLSPDDLRNTLLRLHFDQFESVCCHGVRQ